MGNKKVTIQSLEVVSIDEDRGLLLVKGGVPGAIGGWVSITDAKKKILPPHAPYPVGNKNEKHSNESSTNKIEKSKATLDESVMSVSEEEKTSKEDKKNVSDVEKS